MQAMKDDEVWRLQHDSHVDMQAMRYKSQVWKRLARMDMLKNKWLKGNVCQRHRDVKRSTGLASLNRFSKPGEALGWTM